MAKDCTKPRRRRDRSWFEDKAMLAQAQGEGIYLTVEDLTFLADSGIYEGEAPASTSGTNETVAYQCDDFDAYDSDCDDFHTAKVSFMAKISQAGSAAISEVQTSTDTDTTVVQDSTYLEQENVNDSSNTDLYSDSNIIPYHQYIRESKQKLVTNIDSSVPQEDLIVTLMHKLQDEVNACNKTDPLVVQKNQYL